MPWAVALQADAVGHGWRGEADLSRTTAWRRDGSELPWHFMRMASYQQALRRVQPIVPILFDSLQSGLTMSREDHERKKIKRTGDPHYFAHTVRRETCEKLRAMGLLVTDPEEERSSNSQDLWMGVSRDLLIGC